MSDEVVVIDLEGWVGAAREVRGARQGCRLFAVTPGLGSEGFHRGAGGHRWGGGEQGRKGTAESEAEMAGWP